MGEITSVQPGGVATARQIGGIAKAAIQKSEVPEYPGGLPDSSYYWPDAILSLNTNEIEDRLDQKRKLKDPVAWSKELDSALKISVRDATYKHLLENRSLGQKASILTKPVSVTLIFEGLASLLNQQHPKPQNLLLLYILGGGTLDKTGDLLMRRPVRKGRYSIFHELQLDRVAAVEGLTRVLPIMKKIEG